jgi:hypothetical protein
MRASWASVFARVRSGLFVHASNPVGGSAYAASLMRRLLIVVMVLAGMSLGGTLPSAALASPGWSAPRDFSLPGKPFGSTVQIGYQAGGTATIAYLEVVSFTPLQTVLHAGVVPPGGVYQEQMQIASTINSIPADVKLAEAPDGAAVLQWSALEGSEPETSPLAYVASYRAAGSGAWEAPTTTATDTTRKKNINDTLVPAISADGTAAAGVEHLDPSISAGGYRVDVAVHPPGGVWGPATQVSPTKDSSEGLALGFDANGDLTAAFRLELSNTRHTLAAERRPASSGVWGSLEDITGSDVTSDVFGPALGVSPDGSAVIAFQYVHYTGTKTLDANAVTRSGATGSWTAPVDVAPGGASSGPMAAAVSATDKAYVLYRFQGGSSGEDCVGAVRSATGANSFTSPHCVSPTNFEPGSGGVALLGNDAYFAWSGQPNGGSDVAEGSRWLDGASQPDSFTDLDSPAKSIGFDQLVPDEDGSVAAFWTRETEPEPKKVEASLRAAAFDAGGPNLLSAAVPTSATAGQAVAMSASFVDLWSGLVPPTWSFGDGSSASGAQVSHSYSVPGSYTVTVTAADSLGNMTSSSYPIAVTAVPVSLPLLLPVPALTVLSAKVVGQSVVIRLGCADATCTGEALLTAREKLRAGKLIAVAARHAKVKTTYRRVTVGVAHLTLQAGQTLSVTAALNATGRKLLASFGKLPVTLTVSSLVAKAPVIIKDLTILPSKRPSKRKKH